MTRKSKVIVFSTALPVLVGIGLALWLLVFNAPEAAASTGIAATEIVEVERLVKQEAIEISGNIEPVNSADMAFPIAGYIDAIFVSEGDIVETGMVLATLEDSQQRYDLATVAMEIDTENVTGTTRNLDLLNLKMEMTETSLDDTRLNSTINGLITSIDAEIGDFVTAQAAGASSDVVIRVIDRSDMIATVEVDELDAPFLKVGQQVEFQFDAYPDLEIIGEVSTVPFEARTTTQGIAVLDTEVIIHNPPEEILPYFTFAGEIFLDDEEDVLLIPEGAVMDRGDRLMVMKVVRVEEAEADMPGTDNRPAGGLGMPDVEIPVGYTVMPAQVTTKDYSSGMVQVLSGLEAGDQILATSTTTTAAAGAETAAAGDTSEEEESTNVLEMLGMSSGPGSGGGPPPARN